MSKAIYSLSLLKQCFPEAYQQCKEICRNSTCQSCILNNWHLLHKDQPEQCPKFNKDVIIEAYKELFGKQKDVTEDEIAAIFEGESL